MIHLSPFDVICPHCGVPPQRPCRAKTGRKVGRHHRQRVTARDERQSLLLAKAEQAKALPATIALAPRDESAIEVARDAVREGRFLEAADSVDDAGRVALIAESLTVANSAASSFVEHSLSFALHGVHDAPALVAHLLAAGASWGSPYNELAIIPDQGSFYYAASLVVGGATVSIYGKRFTMPALEAA